MNQCSEIPSLHFDECKEPIKNKPVFDFIPENSTWSISSKRSDMILTIVCTHPRFMSMNFDVDPRHIQKMFDDFGGKIMTYKNKEFTTFDGKTLKLK